MLTPAHKKLLRLEASLKKKAAEVNALRLDLARNCSHPEEFVQPYRWEHDSGYGRQSTHEGLLCGICRFINYWKYPGSWVDPAARRD